MALLWYILGRPLPTADDPVIKQDRVGIMLNPVGAAAWRDCEIVGRQ